ncbi:MAG: hypothetical protein JO001_29930 [Alphaproteobacteria bacterium]|nr:hypothetical protein [Alphaproteobacteria bacterium]
MVDTPNVTGVRQAKQAARERRLADALRQNLRRRKEQRRDRAAPEDHDATQDDNAIEPPGSQA